MKEYKVLLEGKDNKVLVAWEREKSFFYPDGVEYSVHTLGLNDDLIWGHYFTKKEDALEYFSEYLTLKTIKKNGSIVDYNGSKVVICGNDYDSSSMNLIDTHFYIEYVDGLKKPTYISLLDMI